MSEYFFSDDGSLNFGNEQKLRADIETCVAANFKGVGVKKTGMGGKILMKIDDKITQLLKDMKKGG